MTYYREAGAKLQFTDGIPTILEKTKAQLSIADCQLKIVNAGRVVLSVLLALPVAGRAQETFPGITWGTPLREVRHGHQLGLEAETRKPAADERNVERYDYPLDTLGEATIHECLFEFTEGRFSGIILTTRGAENTEALHDYLTKRFGRGSDDGHRFWQWLSEETYVSLDEDSAGDGYVLWYGVRWQGAR